MSYLLFLDDIRHPSDVLWEYFPRNLPFRIARNYQEFAQMVMQHGVPQFVCFDHDLADDHYAAMLQEVAGHAANYGAVPSGYDCAKWLVEYCHQNSVKFPDYVVHSMNPVGRERIIAYINNAKKHLPI